MSDNMSETPQFDETVIEETQNIEEQIDPNTVLKAAVENNVDINKQEEHGKIVPMPRPVKPKKQEDPNATAKELFKEHMEKWVRDNPHPPACIDSPDSRQEYTKAFKDWTQRITEEKEKIRKELGLTADDVKPIEREQLSEHKKTTIDDNTTLIKEHTDNVQVATSAKEEFQETKPDTKEPDSAPVQKENEKPSETEEDGFVLETELYKKEATEEEDVEEEATIDLNEDTGLIPHVIIDEDTEEHIPELIIDTKGDITVEQEGAKEKTDVQKETEDLEEKISKRTGTKIHGYNIDSVLSSVSTENQVLKKLRKYNIPIEKIEASINTSEESTHQAFLNQYNTPSKSPIIAPRISRFPLLLSGYYAEMRNYTYGEHASVVKNATNPDLKYSNRLQEELVSLFKHITWTSYQLETKEQFTFDKWATITKFPDLKQFYYGAFDATYPGETSYRITCGARNCNHEFSVVRTNRELNYILQKDIKPDFIRNVLLEKIPVRELRTLQPYIEANSIYEGKVLPSYHFKIGYTVPSIRDILEWLTVFEEELTDYEDFNGLVDPEKPEHNVLKLFTHICKVTVPVIMGKNTDGKDIIRFHCVDATIADAEKRLENRKYILKLLKDLDKDIFRELFTGKEVAEKVKLVGIVHMLHNITCPNCGVNLVRIPIDMEDTFFMEAVQTVRTISLY